MEESRSSPDFEQRCPNIRHLLEEFALLVDSDSLPLFRGDTGGDHLVLRYGSHPDFDRPIVALEYGQALVGHLHGTVEGVEAAGDGVVTHLRCDVIDLGRLLFLLDILGLQRNLSVSDLADDAEQVAWSRAALDGSSFLTPWLGLGPKFDTDLSFDVPNGRHVSLTPSLFGDLPRFFNLTGHMLFGRGGYGGQDLNGFEEVVKKMASLDDRFWVSIPDPARCRAAAAAIGPGFYDELLSILGPFVRPLT